MDCFNITLDLIHCNFIRFFYRVPNTEVVPVLSDDNIGSRNPAYILAIVKQGLLLLLFDVVKMKLPSLVSEEKFVATRIKFKVVNL